MWWSRRVPRANIPQKLRDRFEQFGENALDHALGAGQHSEPQPELAPLLKEHRDEIYQWLKERRNLAAQREQRLDFYTRWTFWTALAAVIVGIIGVLVSYFLQTTRPELAASGGTIHLEDSITEELNWTNIGKKPARSGSATVFILGDDGLSKHKVGESAISGINKEVIAADYGAAAKFALNNIDETVGMSLACVIYYDESGDKYRQAFRYRRGSVQPKSITLEVLSSPKYSDMCP